jgi:hypothetical protein
LDDEKNLQVQKAGILTPLDVKNTEPKLMFMPVSTPLSNLQIQRQTTRYETNESEAPATRSFEPSKHQEKVNRFKTVRKSKKARTLASELIQKVLIG